jgi:hypothetical protein
MFKTVYGAGQGPKHAPKKESEKEKPDSKDRSSSVKTKEPKATKETKNEALPERKPAE